MTQDIPQDYIDAFQEIADLTAPKCVGCRAPHTCCSRAQCDDTRRFAMDTFGIALEETGHALPFMGPNGCVVPAHLRPICSVHVCEGHLGVSREFDDAYFNLREQAEEALISVTGIFS